MKTNVAHPPLLFSSMDAPGPPLAAPLDVFGAIRACAAWVFPIFGWALVIILVALIATWLKPKYHTKWWGKCVWSFEVWFDAFSNAYTKKNEHSLVKGFSAQNVRARFLWSKPYITTFFGGILFFFFKPDLGKPTFPLMKLRLCALNGQSWATWVCAIWLREWACPARSERKDKKSKKSQKSQSKTRTHSLFFLSEAGHVCYPQTLTPFAGGKI